MHKLTNEGIKSLFRNAVPGVTGDGGGLYFQVGKTGTASWLFRFQINKSPRRAMGLGKYPETSLKEARTRASEARKLVEIGIDPIDAREADQLERKAAKERAKTFRQCAEELIDSKRSGWRSDKHAEQWTNTLTEYAYPIIGDKPVGEVTTDDVIRILRPIWTVKNETASRVRNRIELVIAASATQGRFEGKNPAQWKSHLENILPKRSKVAPVEHHAAMPYQDIPEFWPKLRAAHGMAARALQFTILTACRTSEALNAQWSEIDLESRIWTIPGSRMKAGKTHRSPLSDQAVALIESLDRINGNQFVFPGMKEGKPLSNLAMLMLLRRMGMGHFTVHGYRSSFRDFAAEETSAPHVVAEQALAHTIGNAVEAAYLRSDLLSKRRELMQLWADHCHSCSHM